MSGISDHVNFTHSLTLKEHKPTLSDIITIDGFNNACKSLIKYDKKYSYFHAIKEFQVNLKLYVLIQIWLYHYIMQYSMAMGQAGRKNYKKGVK